MARQPRTRPAPLPRRTSVSPPCRADRQGAAAKFDTNCSWCIGHAEVQKPGEPPKSHGICERHAAEVLAEAGIEMEPIKNYDKLLNPPSNFECGECPAVCADGKIHGTDANGSEVSEPCDCNCHIPLDVLAVMEADRRNDAEREGA